MNRRECISFLAAAAATRAQPAIAQQPKRLPVVAIVYSVGSVAEMAGTDPLGVNMRAFERGLRDLGWIVGRTIMIERRSSEGEPERATALLTEVIARRPDVIMLGGARWLHEAALRATRTIPIVAPFGEDPVATGLISSLGFASDRGGRRRRPSAAETISTRLFLASCGTSDGILDRFMPF